MLKTLYRYLNGKFVSKLYEQQYEDWCGDPVTQEALEAYDKWKDSYRDAWANYEAAHDRKDYEEAERWWKIFEVLFTPRLKWHGLTSIAQIQYLKYPAP